ncbi:LysR family transcriptional regulator [uncultured Ferrimonas sp.]|uniref:LysR family transcriptional regulator n=1 Tax=uncultured Ferrimonas sp. TaxID=432640 RepID=UPI00260605F8|nr:LysR family transcriptional regulator [uncultured Ferrimonas sp.]
MNIDHLQLFVRLAHTHNISAAGQELGLSPAVSSSYITKLERNLGVRLVHRTTRKVSLTEEGHSFLPHAEQVLAQVDAARAAISPDSQQPKGTLRIAASASFATLHLMPALKTFCQRYPELNIDLRLTDTVVDLIEGGFDVAIRNSALKDSSLVARKLAPDQRILCASPSYLAAHGEPKTPQELLQHQCVSLVGIEQWRFNGSEGAISIKPSSGFRSDNGTAVRMACCDGFGIGLSATWSVYQELRSGQLVQVLADHPLDSDTALWALYPSAHQLAPKIRAFIDFFIDHLGEPPYWQRDSD